MVLYLEWLAVLFMVEDTTMHVSSKLIIETSFLSNLGKNESQKFGRDSWATNTGF